VTAESPGPGPGSGTVFTVTLPLIAFAGAVGIPRSSRTPLRPMMVVPADALQGCRALVIDDDLDALDLFSRLLQRAGAQVRTASSAKDAQAAMTAAPFDVVLSDIEMPGEDGMAFIQRLRSNGARIPVVAVTAYGSTEDRVRMLAAGFDAHVAKPVDAAELVAVVRRLLARGAGH
jgi:CheY-like chemotaxis protein